MSTHRCPVDDCAIDVAADKLMCQKHWRMVPKDTQDDVYITWRRSNRAPSDVKHAAAHRDAMRRATDAVNEKLRERERAP